MQSANLARPFIRALTVLAVAALATLAIAASALAAPTVSVTGTTNVLSVSGGSEDSNIDVSFSAGNYVVENTGGTLSVSGTSCILVDTDKATCFFGGLAPGAIYINSSSGVDNATLDSSVPSTVTAIVRGVSTASSANAPLDVTTDNDSLWPSVVGSPYPDSINIDSPEACSAAVNGGDGDDEIHVDVEVRDDSLELGCYGPFVVTGGDGDDLIEASHSKIDLEYEASAGHDVFVGGSGNDHITVGDGPDWAFGGAGSDRFYDNGGGDPSKLWGGSGSDVFTDWDASDADVTFFDGGSGVDNVAYHNLPSSPPNVTLSLDNAANDGVSGEYDNIRTSVENISDWVYGSGGQFNGNDTLTGSDAANAISGFEGDDTIDGLGGNDTLKGGAGDDAITGGAGPDLIYGEEDDDEIFAEDGADDTISCGSGTDVVHADAGDTVNGDCETVL